MSGAVQEKNLLILAPHADDEIFCIPHAKYLESNGYSITILFLSGSIRRFKEAKNSCQMLRWGCIIATNHGDKYADGFFHFKLPSLVQYLQDAFENYSLVLCPALEGGHQDHDTTFVACMMALSDQSHCEVLFFKTYTATGRWKFFEVFSRENYCKFIKFIPSAGLNHRFWLIRLALIFFVYRSQWSSWIALLPAMLFATISGRNDKIYTLAYADYRQDLDCILDSESLPLYEIHQRCSKQEWLSCIRPSVIELPYDSSLHKLFKL